MLIKQILSFFWRKRKIRIIDIILHKNAYSTQMFIVLNRKPEFIYRKEGDWLIAEDSGFFNFYYYEKPGRAFQAFAGREFDISLTNGEVIKATGQWWDGVPEQYRHLADPGSGTIDGLGRCNVFCSTHLDQKMIDKWLYWYTPSNNYNKYCKRGKNFGVHIIKSKWD